MNETVLEWRFSEWSRYAQICALISCQTQNSSNACFNILPGLRRKDSDPLFQTRLMKGTQRFTFGIAGGAETGLLRIVRQLHAQWTWL